MMLRHMDAQGNWLHTINNTESTLTLIAGQSTYDTGIGVSNIDAGILKLEYAAVLFTNQRHPLTIYDKYISMSSDLRNGGSSEPMAVYLQRAASRADNKMIFFPTPSSGYTVVYNFRRPLFDFDLPGDNPDFPSDFQMPIQKMLSYELAPHYNKTQAERVILKQDADIAMEESKISNMDKPSGEPLVTEYF